MKYKLVKFTNGLGQTWYQIKIPLLYIGKFGIYRWYKIGRNTESGWTSFIPTFDTEQEAHDYLKKEEQEITENKLRNTVSMSEKEIVYEI